MKKLIWPLLIALVAVVAIFILLRGQQQPDTAQSAAPVVEPATGGVYAEALVGSLGRLNPVFDLYNDVDREVDRLIFSGLVRFDDRGLPQPDLADSWGISQDGQTYNFSIRPNATWHDGQPVTSDDVIFTLELLRNENSPTPADVRELWNQIEVVRLGDKAIQFRLPEPYAPFLDYLTFGVLPAHLVGDLTIEELVDAPFNVQPVGSGPYQIEQVLQENGQITGLVLEIFDGYYGKKPYIEQITFKYYPDARSALKAYQEGNVMGINEVTADILPGVLKEPQLQLYTGRLPQLTLILFNLDNPQVAFFKEASIRKALLYGLDRQWMVDRILGGQAYLADGPIFPGTWAYYDGMERLAYDPNKAITLIQQAGYTVSAEGGSIRQKEGVAFEFELLYPDDDAHGAMAEAIADDWLKLGVQVDLKAVPYDALISDYLDPRSYQAALVDLNLTRSPDPDPYPFWHQAQITGGQNYSKWDDRQASEYLEQARVVLDIGERTRYYRNFQVRFAQEMPALPLFYPVYSFAVSSEVQGVRMGPLFDTSDRFNTIATWFLLVERSNNADTTATP